jgi:Undecaprenyl-phosphate galactose phosphotransferase WbaP
MFLTIWVDRGLVGIAGLMVLLVVLALRTVQHRDRAVAVVLIGIGVMNLFDATLLSGTVIYPLAAILGWRAVGHRPLASAETGPGSAAAVRLSLALGDALAGAAAISLALVTTTGIGGWTFGLGYATLVWPLMGGVARLYPGYGRTSPNELSGSVTAAGVAGLLLTLGAALLPNTFPLPPSGLVTMVASSLLLAPAIRYAIKKSLRALHLWGRPAVLLGTGASAERTATHLLANRGLGIHLMAVFGSSNEWNLQRLPITGTLEHAWRYITDNNIRHAIVTSDAAQELGFDEVLRRADRQLRFVQFLPDLKGLPSSSVVATPLGSALALEVRNQLASGTNRAVKRIIDVVVSTIMLAVLALPLAIVALIIRLDSPGPVLHLSPRLGRYGRTFSCIKFRTMFVDAQQRLEHIMATDASMQTEYEQYRKLSNDPRVTRVGRILRRLSIDEFPQLINVVVGQMSMVGPRPYLVSEFDAMGPDRDLILLARPGITGYWQVEARNDVDFEERQAMEADYVRNWSVWWDMVILVSTPLAMLGPDGK